MDTTLSALLNFYVFSTGRRMFAMGQVQKAAQAAGHIALAAHCEATLAHDASARELEARWLGQDRNVQFSPEARQLDILVDGALTALRDGLDAAARASEPGDPLGDAAVQLEKKLFPRGVAEITTRPFVEEVSELDRILGVVKTPEWAPVVAGLGVGRHVDRLAALEPKYRAAIEGKGTKLTFADVKDARAKGQSWMLQAVAMILGLVPSDSPADQAARAQLLGPILVQNEAIRGYMRARRSVQDVNPSTGELEPNAPPPANDGTPATPPPTE